MPHATKQSFDLLLAHLAWRGKHQRVRRSANQIEATIIKANQCCGPFCKQEFALKTSSTYNMCNRVLDFTILVEKSAKLLKKETEKASLTLRPKAREQNSTTESRRNPSS